MPDVHTDASSSTATAASGDGRWLSRTLRAVAARRFPLVGEMAVLGLVIGAWELLRMPLEGPLALSLAHARDWLEVERLLHIDIEASAIRLAHDAGAVDLLHWGYWNLHLPVLFGFMALARMLAPERYPSLRSAFVLSHVPALIVIGLYPLAPPRWVPGIPFAVTAPEGLNGAMHNATAAAASQHVGYPVFIAAATIWLAPRSRLALLSLAYPAVVFAIVVGTANHYVLDAVVGGLCVAFGIGGARLIHGDLRGIAGAPEALLAPALLAAVGYAFIVHAINTASELSLPPGPFTSADFLLVAGIAAALAAWRWSETDSLPSTETAFQDSIV